MVDASLGARGKTCGALHVPRMPAAGLLTRKASANCTAVLDCCATLSSSKSDSSVFRQHCVCIATVPMSFTFTASARFALPAALCAPTCFCRPAKVGTPTWRNQACLFGRHRHFQSTCNQTVRQDLTTNWGRLLRRPEPPFQYAFLHLVPGPGVGTS